MSLERIAVLGAGIMGRGIAYVAAVAGYETTLYDVSPAALARGEAEIRALMDKGVAAGKLEAAVRDRARLAAHAELVDATHDADLVIEAVPEDMRLKIDTFAELDARTKPGTILATNTSSLSITEMAGATEAARPRRRHALLQPGPPHEAARDGARARDLGRDDRGGQRRRHAHGQGVAWSCASRPGFVTTRINALIGNEAFRMLEEGVASARDIDKALKLGLNHPMGPFEMVDLVGLDMRLSILEFLHETLGERYRPTNLMVQYVKAGRLGRKVRQGRLRIRRRSLGHGERSDPGSDRGPRREARPPVDRRRVRRRARRRDLHHHEPRHRRGADDLRRRPGRPTSTRGRRGARGVRSTAVGADERRASAGASSGRSASA